MKEREESENVKRRAKLDWDDIEMRERKIA